MGKNPLAVNVQLTHLYDDIIDMDYPLQTTDTIKHPRMTLEDRAKIFMPFAALRGYEEAIAAKQRVVVPKVELSEEMKEELDRRLQVIEMALDKGEHPVVSVVYFEQEKGGKVDEGTYIRFTGMVARFLPTARLIQIVDRKLLLDDIREIDGEIFD